MRFGLTLTCIAAVLALTGGAAEATLLNLDATTPVVYSASIFVTYDADGAAGGALGLLQADGWPMQAQASDSDPVTDLWAGVFDLDFEIDPATGNFAGGSLLVTGDLDGINEVTIFESDTAFAFGYGSEDLFEFKFVQKGDTDYAADGDIIGVILDGRNITDFSTPTFGSDFSGDGFAKSDTFIVPEPATMALLGIGGGLALLRRRRR